MSKVVLHLIEKPIAAPTDTASLQHKVSGFIKERRDSVRLAAKKIGALTTLPIRHSMYNIIARLKLAAYPADIWIEIARNACGALECERADEMIE